MVKSRKAKTCARRMLLGVVMISVLLTNHSQSYAASLGTAAGNEQGQSSTTAEEWRRAVLAHLMQGGPAMQHAAEYIIANDVEIRFRALKTGAMWWIDGNMYLNSDRYSPSTRPDHPYMLALIAHEAKHLEQGPVVALSVYGELEAWQVQYAVFKELVGTSPGTYEERMAWDELSQLPLSSSRENLEIARQLMQYIGGANYPIDKLPLWPLPAEIKKPS
jgi:hypothetical protein